MHHYDLKPHVVSLRPQNAQRLKTSSTCQQGRPELIISNNYSAIKHRSPVSNSNSICSLIFRVRRGEPVKPSADVAEICSLRPTLNRPQFNRYFKLSKLVFMFKKIIMFGFLFAHRHLFLRVWYVDAGLQQPASVWGCTSFSK